MRKSIFSESVRFLLLAGLLLPLQNAEAASWQWSTQQNGRERITLNLDAARQEQDTKRSAPTELAVTLGTPISTFTRTGTAPAPGSLVSGLSANGGSVQVNLRDAAFGYVVSRPAPNRVVIDVFPDPLGTRWKSPGTPAPATAPSRAASAQPEAPTITDPPVHPVQGAALPMPAQPNQQPPQAPARTPAQIPAQTQNARQAPQQAPQRAMQPAEPTGHIPMPDPGNMSSNATTLGRMATAASPSTPTTQTTAPATTPPVATPQQPEQAAGVMEGISPAERERRTLQATPRNATEPLPSEQDLSNLTSHIEALPTTSEDSAFAWPDLNRPHPAQVAPEAPATNPAPAAPVTNAPATPPARRPAVATPPRPAPAAPAQQATPQRQAPISANSQQNPPLGSAERLALERSLGQQPPVNQPPVAQAPRQNQVTPANQTTVRNLPEGLHSTNGAVRGSMGGNPPAVSMRMPAQQQAVQAMPQTVPQPMPQAQPVSQQQFAPQQYTPQPVQQYAQQMPQVAPQQQFSQPMRQPQLQQYAQPVRQPQAPQQAQQRWQPQPVPQPVAQPTAFAPQQPQQRQQAMPQQAQPVAPRQPMPQQAGQMQGGTQQAPTFDTEESAVSPETMSAIRNILQPTPNQDVQKDIPDPGQDVIYIDEEGRQIPKPPDIPTLLSNAHKSLDANQPQEALDTLKILKDQPLTNDQREDVLYMISEATEKANTSDWLKGYEPIVSTTSEAMNYNLKSPRVADALMRLGMINLKTGSYDDAAAYFNVLRKDFPQKPGIPEAYLALGKDHFDKGRYAEAVQNFQLILDKYPESKAVREGARYMADALYRQGHDSRALILVDFVNRRWPRLYLEDTDYLAMVGDLLNRVKRLDDALQTYWTYYNLIPDNPRNSDVLLNIGDIYFQTDMPKGAKDVLEELLRKYNDSAAAPVALRRIGENGIYDGNPNLEDLFSMFARPNATSPEIYYQKILDSYPNSPEAPVASLRFAAWRFWDKDISPAMVLAQDFLKKHPNSIYGPRAEEILRRGFNQEFATAMDEQNYDRILTLWDRYPEVRLDHPTLNDDLRVALARAHLNRGEENEGMDLLAPFLDRPKDPDYGEYAYNMFLSKALRTEDWDGVLNLGEKVANWDMPKPVKAQLDYARAISAENLGMPGRALPLWRNLYRRDDIPLYQKAYATYFMAREAERQRDLDQAYKYNVDTLKLFSKLQEDRSDKADPERIRESLAALMDVTEVMNRFAESLDWADKYVSFVDKKSPDYSAWQFRVARLNRKMGDQGRWRTILDEIVAREPNSVYGRMAASELRTQDVARNLTRFTSTN